jgi:hypothetical protein
MAVDRLMYDLEKDQAMAHTVATDQRIQHFMNDHLVGGGTTHTGSLTRDANRQSMECYVNVLGNISDEHQVTFSSGRRDPFGVFADSVASSTAGAPESNARRAAIAAFLTDFDYFVAQQHSKRAKESPEMQALLSMVSSLPSIENAAKMACEQIKVSGYEHVLQKFESMRQSLLTSTGQTYPEYMFELDDELKSIRERSGSEERARQDSEYVRLADELVHARSYYISEMTKLVQNDPELAANGVTSYESLVAWGNQRLDEYTAAKSMLGEQ